MTGISDSIVKHAREAFEAALPLGWDYSDIKKAECPRCHTKFFSELLAKTHRETVLYNLETNSWWLYSCDEGIFSEATNGQIYALVESLCKDFYGRPVQVSTATCKEILEGARATQEAYLTRGDTGAGLYRLIPFNNGVLKYPDLSVLHEFEPAFKLTYKLPFNWDSNAKCDGILAWLNECLRFPDADIKVIRAFSWALLTGKIARYHKAMMPVGKPRSGKGTLIRIFIAVVGSANSVSTNLQKLESSPFEASRLYGKLFAFVNEVEKHYGTTNRFQNITGGDPVTYEVKGKQATSDFTFKGLVALSGNRPVLNSDDSRALDSRIFYLLFKEPNAARRRRELLELENGLPIGEFASELPGFVNWALMMEPQEADEVLGTMKPSPHAALLAHSEEEPILLFLQECTVVALDSAKQGKAIDFEHYSLEFKTLYDSYKHYCNTNGHSVHSKKTFSQRLRSLADNFGLPIKAGKTTGNVSVVAGIDLREIRSYGKTREGEPVVTTIIKSNYANNPDPISWVIDN